MTKKYSVVSLFSGCGGMDLGFRGGFSAFSRQYRRHPFDIVWANDLNSAACATYRRNLGDHVRQADVWSALETLPKRADVVIGGFPCQDISINGLRKGVNGKRSGLYRAMVAAVAAVRPRIFVAENVRGLLMKYNESSLATVLNDFETLGYTVTYRLYNAADYGVPQNRQRVFIVGVAGKGGIFVPPKPTSAAILRMTASEAIGDLETIPENTVPNHIWSRANPSAEQGNRLLRADDPAPTIRAECHGNIQFHYRLKRRISMREAARLQSFPDSFVFESKLRETERQIGNAVPPILAWHIAKAVARTLA